MTEKEVENQRENEKKTADEWLWNEATKDVVPIRSHETYVQETSKRAKTHIQPQERENKKPQPERVQITPDYKVQARPGSEEVDRKTAQRLKRGQLSIDGRLDLHGLSQVQAYDAINTLIPDMYHRGKRCVLVITGKGAPKSGHTPLTDHKPGVLRQKAPGWINENHLRQYVLKVQTARPAHGGEGALYVLLRRQRS